MSKNIILTLLIILLFSCSKIDEITSEHLSEIKDDAVAILESSPLFGVEVEYNKFEAIIRLKPQKVFVTEDGLYIVLNSIFVSQSGLFIPTQDFQVKSIETSDLSYKEIENGVYSYSVKG